VARRPIDLSLYLVTDDAVARGRSVERIVREALSGGATAVQLREKSTPAREFVEHAERLRAITTAAGVALIVNDRVDVALAVDADGVHVGQADLPADRARGLLGDERVLGVTVSDGRLARRAHLDGADYLGSTAVFATSTKPDGGPPLGLAALRELVLASSLPVVAIGGIHAGNARSVLETGVAGIAVVSAILAADDPRAAARELAEIVRSARR
jgi:thiamine-phosphate pyrophosphorylase